MSASNGNQPLAGNKPYTVLIWDCVDLNNHKLYLKTWPGYKGADKKYEKAADNLCYLENVLDARHTFEFRL
ncbi:Protein of unknown function [Pyronema omphalodes CBS 100304]|uniref:Uncharacterized protein n=1 Tax=Pyronema omphalodes (strain CBS 100304) TaxID=1076935 RepID=U4L3A1_PYROM|nr:Protein of unknown function [Pyronema omphalodes CBS 100304]